MAEISDLPWTAKLDRGSVYVLRTGPDSELRFERGVPVPISDEVREHLEANAVERRVRFHNPDEDETEIVETCSFTFAPNKGAEP